MTQRCRWPVSFALVASVVFTAAVAALAPPAAAASGLTIGSSNTVTADPPVPRPSTTPCTVTLFSNLKFADFTPKTFSYTPPAGCPGPWAKVVLEADFSVTAGVQFDRTTQIAVAHVNVFYGTTPEPGSTLSPSWHVERDLTDYSALFATAQSGDVNLGNLVNSTYTGIIFGSATLQLYPAGAQAPAPVTADQVLPLSDAPGGAAQLTDTASILAPDLTLPANIESAYLDVITQSQSNDEFWYTCVPDDVATKLQSCPGTSFREGEITVDGQPAGIAPVYPWIFTGGIDPFLWRPLPGVQTLNFVPYRIDLTPFAALLSDGKTHQVGVSVFNANNYFLVAASLLLYLDHGATQVTGALTRDTLSAAPVPSIQEDLTTDSGGELTGMVNTSAQRSFTLAGYVNTSHGRVVTRVAQTVSFTNQQQFSISSAIYQQFIEQNTTIRSNTTTRNGQAVRQVSRQTSYPLNVEIVLPFNADGSFDQITTIQQTYASSTLATGAGRPATSTVINSVSTKDDLQFNASGGFTGHQGQQSGQTYFSRGTGAACYSMTLAAQDNALSSITNGKGCPNQGGS
jgi:hypothetical protein